MSLYRMFFGSRIRLPKSKTVLRGIILVLVLVIALQVLDLTHRDCKIQKYPKGVNHDSNINGLPWPWVNSDNIPVQKRLSVNGGSDDSVRRPSGEVAQENTFNISNVADGALVNNKTRSIRYRKIRKNRPVCFKQVHIWSREYTLWKQGEFRCPGLPCGIRQFTSTSFKTMQRSDAVVFWHESFWDWDEMHRNRPEGQKWILTTRESPVNTRRSVIPRPKYAKNSYDYIMTYHEDSDFYGGFGRYDPTKPKVPKNDTRNWAAGKTSVVAWAARNCNNSYVKWKRSEFVHKLSEMISVDMYGRCGNQSCPRNEKVCDETLKRHKFFLSLENCNCRNYITEKFWKMAFQYDMIPVVYGPPRVDYEAVAPPRSFIHVEDFNSLKELADYLDLLDMNDDRYNEYFAWKKVGSVQETPTDWVYQPEQMCQVVERLLDDERAIANKTYTPNEMPDWDHWWRGSCKEIANFPLVMN